MDNNNKNNNNEPKKSGGIITLILFILIILLGLSWIIRIVSGTGDKEVAYSEFLQMVDEGQVEKVIIASDRIAIYPVGSESAVSTLLFGGTQDVKYTGKIEEDDTLTARLLEKGIEVSGEIPDNSSQIWYFIFAYILPIVLIAIFGFILIRRVSKSDGVGGFMNIGKSNAKVYVQKDTGKTFKDVAGEDEAIESLQEVVDFLHNPDKYAKIGAKLPKGALLVGPPGTGKTLLAKAVAGEAKVPFYFLTGSDFVEVYVGAGAARVRDLFKEAEKNSPCIIFIDEIDAIGRSRDSRMGGGNDEREQTLNQLLAEMDGFDGKKGVIILAATNRPEILDKALLRPGRFDRRIIVDEPDIKGRVEILKVHAKDVKMDETVDFEEIALATSGAVGSDLANMINEAAIMAVKKGREFVSQEDLFNAFEIVIAGKEKKSTVLSKEERKIVSYHEIGHALVSAVQKNSEPVQKITIVPRQMGSLGYVLQVPEKEKNLRSKEDLYSEVVEFLGGRAAEKLVFDSITTGAQNDIERATKLVRNMIAMYGMSDKFGPVGFVTVESQYLDKRAVMNCAAQTEAEIDEEIMRILKQAYDEAYAILEDNREIMDKLADYLIAKETITGAEFMKIYCEEKGIPIPESKKDELRKDLEEAKAKEEAKKVEDEAEKSEQTEEPSESNDKTETAATPEEVNNSDNAETDEEKEKSEEKPQPTIDITVSDEDDSFIAALETLSEKNASAEEIEETLENEFANALKNRVYNNDKSDNKDNNR